MKKEKDIRPIVVNDDESIPSGFGIGKGKFDKLNKKQFSFITKMFKFIKFKLKNWKETRLVNKFKKLSREICLNGPNANKDFVKILKLKKEKFHLLNKFREKSICFGEDIERRNSDPVIANIHKLEPLSGDYEDIKEFLVNKSKEYKDN